MNGRDRRLAFLPTPRALLHLALLATLAGAVALTPRVAAAEDVAFTIQNCESERRKIDVKVFDYVDEITMFAVSAWTGMNYQQTIGFRCVRRKPADPARCRVNLTIPGDVAVRYQVENGAKQCFTVHDVNFGTMRECSC